MEVNKKKRGISLSHQLLAPSTAGNVSLPKHSDFRLELSESQAVIRKAIALTPSKPRVVYTPTPQISFAYVNQKVQRKTILQQIQDVHNRIMQRNMSSSMRPIRSVSAAANYPLPSKLCQFACSTPVMPPQTQFVPLRTNRYAVDQKNLNVKQNEEDCLRRQQGNNLQNIQKEPMKLLPVLPVPEAVMSAEKPVNCNKNLQTQKILQQLRLKNQQKKEIDYHSSLRYSPKATVPQVLDKKDITMSVVPGLKDFPYYSKTNSIPVPSIALSKNIQAISTALVKQNRPTLVSETKNIPSSVVKNISETTMNQKKAPEISEKPKEKKSRDPKRIKQLQQRLLDIIRICDEKLD